MPSEFEVLIDAQAGRDLKQLAKAHHPVLPRIKRAIESLANDPFQGKPLKGSKRGCYSLREGDYRIIYEVYPEKRVILLIRVGDRKDVYQ